MREIVGGAGDGDAWVSAGAAFEPIEGPPAPRAKRPPSSDARPALAIAALGVLFFGFILGPIAVALAQRAELAQMDRGADGHPQARAAAKIGRLGMALHLAIALAAIPWVMFMLPLIFE
ncbi:MAG TPA: hypothetical protein VGM56_29090 [Byssovorax sp.]|jgi:hypothetical protein